MIAVACALGAALCNALSTIFERMGVETAPPEASMRLALIRHALRRPVWLLGFAAMVSAFGLQVIALSRGQLTLVQPLLVTELVFLVFILRVWFAREVGPREVMGVLMTAAGLGTFLAVSQGSGGNSTPAVSLWVITSAICAGVVVLCVLLARRGSRAWRSACYGSAGAVAFAICAAYIKSMTAVAQQVGLLHMFEHFEPYAVAVTGVLGLFMAQNAFHAGPITASQASLVIVDPIVSILLGLELFDEPLRGSSGALVLDAVSLLVMSLGLLILCHSPLMVGANSDEPLGLIRRRKASRSLASDDGH
jgi:drug/metabolite transporter (DMT)-like permease